MYTTSDQTLVDLKRFEIGSNVNSFFYEPRFAIKVDKTVRDAFIYLHSRFERHNYFYYARSFKARLFQCYISLNFISSIDHSFPSPTSSMKKLQSVSLVCMQLFLNGFCFLVRASEMQPVDMSRLEKYSSRDLYIVLIDNHSIVKNKFYTKIKQCLSYQLAYVFSEFMVECMKNYYV